MIVENRAGGGGMIGTAAVAKGPKDGSMLLFHSSSLITAAATMKAVPVDVTTELTPVALVADGPMLVGVSAASGIKTPAELVAAARTKPEGITAGSGGIGSVGHLAAELLNDAAKVQIRHIPYKGAAPALTDVAAGTVDLLIASYSTLGPQVRSGRVVPIAVTSAQPSAAYPGVPPMGSAAPGYQTGIWYGMFAPAGVPPALLARLNAEIVDIAKSGDVQALVKADGAAAVPSSPEELAPRIRRELATVEEAGGRQADRRRVTDRRCPICSIRSRCAASRCRTASRSRRCAPTTPVPTAAPPTGTSCTTAASRSAARRW